MIAVKMLYIFFPISWLVGVLSVVVYSDLTRRGRYYLAIRSVLVSIVATAGAFISLCVVIDYAHLLFLPFGFAILFAIVLSKRRSMIPSRVYYVLMGVLAWWVYYSLLA